MAGIYVHIPFCKSRCIYCDFFSTTSLTERDRYVAAIKKELELRINYLPSNTEIETIYFGGGTPSMLSASQLCDILKHIKHIYQVSNDAEITAEGNPDDLNEDFLRSIREGGFNRLSMGIQTFNDRRLEFLCRRHTAEIAKRSIENARKVGFDNISIDLMYGFPNESLEDWNSDIDQALLLAPEHISAYSLMYEEGTQLYKMLESGRIEEIDEDISVAMYNLLIERLRSSGYEHYEISNWGKPSMHSRHNSSYWEGIPYLGVGAGAHSFDGNSRQWNPNSLEEYLEGITSHNPIIEKEVLTPNQRFNEMVMTGLRTAKGINLKRLETLLGEHRLEYCIKNARPHIEAGRLELCDNTNSMRLTRNGLFVSDDIMSDLMML